MTYSVKFMFADATTMEQDFGEGITIQDAKLLLIKAWPQGKDPISGPQDLKMIHSGKVLEDAKTFEDYKVPMRQKVIMHLQPKPPTAKIEVVEAPPKPVEQARNGMDDDEEKQQIYASLSNLAEESINLAEEYYMLMRINQTQTHS